MTLVILDRCFSSIELKKRHPFAGMAFVFGIG